MYRKNILLLAGLFVTFGILSHFQVNAALKLPALIGNNMVLQQNATINVWGWADEGETISIKAGWLQTAVFATTSADGKWETSIKTPSAGGPYKMEIAGRDYTITIENVLIGEVWVCSGQSNMEFTLRGLGGWALYPREVREDVKNCTSVRLFTVKRDTSAIPLADCKGNWSQADTNTVNDFSATAWFYGSYLNKKLGVPVGLIVSAWGGTPAEVWTPVENIKSEPDLGFYLNHFNGNQWWPGTPGVLYNAMIHPLLNYTIKGAIWYQGESNAKDARFYPTLMNTLITSWRKNWGVGEFPFYFVQIAPFNYGEPFTGALLREAQLKCLSTPNTGMAVTMDIAGDVNDIHPKNKLDVGKRLANWALNNTYGIKEVGFSGPIYKEMKIAGSSISVSFQYAEGGLKIQKSEQNIFSIAGADRVFYPATVKVQGEMLVVSSPKVKQPKSVRYGFSNTSVASLFNEAGFPASSVRTDDWDIITENVDLKAFLDPASKAVSYQLSTKARETDIYYEFGKKPNKKSQIFRSEIPAGKSGKLFATVSRDGYLSENSQEWDIVNNKAAGAKIIYNSEFSDYYSANGKIALVDGILATDNFQDGSWQGFEGSDLDVIVDLGKAVSAKSISCNFLSANNSWIFLPKKVTVQVSEDGKTYTNIGESSFSAEKEIKNAVIQTVSFPVKSKLRFIKITALNQGTCPKWHQGAGNKSWLFVDEIVVK
jgi:sialate O-acetylesterase